MGQAKQRRAAQAAADSLMGSVDFARVAQAVYKLTAASSPVFGADCLLQAALAQSILSRLGVPAKVQAGYAAWRVGEGDGDVISHRPGPGMVLRDPRELPFHAWLEVGSHIFDVTTRQLAHKAQQLDALDGGSTTVQWQPDYLLIPIERTSGYKDVANGSAGLCYYSPQPEIARIVIDGQAPLEEESIALAWTIYQNPTIQVCGPNDMERQGTRAPMTKTVC